MFIGLIYALAVFGNTATESDNNGGVMTLYRLLGPGFCHRAFRLELYPTAYLTSTASSCKNYMGAGSPWSRLLRMCVRAFITSKIPKTFNFRLL